MPNGLYGKAAPLANVLTQATDTTTAAGTIRTVTIGAVNTTKKNAHVTILVSKAATPETTSLVDTKTFERLLKPGGEYERAGLPLSPGERVYVKTDVYGVVFDVRGFEGKE